MCSQSSFSFIFKYYYSISASRFHFSERKRIRRSGSKSFQPLVLPTLNITQNQHRRKIMSTLAEKLLSFPENAEEKNSETKTNEKDEIQKDEKKTLRCSLTLYPVEFRNWPIFSLLKLEFISQIHIVMVYDSGNSAIIVTKDKNVYNLGYNKDGLKTSDIHAPCLNKIEELSGKNIKTFAHSLYFILALTEEGEVYSWQFKNRKSNVEEFFVSRPTRVTNLNEKHIVDIACGSNHSLALTSDGEVYAWGENDYRQVGYETTTIFDGSVPRQVTHELRNKNVIHIACGSTFNMVITDDNKLYGWGNNENKQILIDDASEISRFDFPVRNTIGISNSTISQKHNVYPREIVISKKIVKVACGFEHTIALTDEGEIYAWGKDNYESLCIKMLPSGPIKMNVPQMGKVLDIAAYGNLSVAEDCDRTIYVWGIYFNQHINTPFRTSFSRIHDPFAYNSYKVMHKPLTVSTNAYKYVEEILKILESLEKGFDDSSSSDFTIQVEGQPIHVHKAILNMRCHYFKNKFKNDWTENNQNVSDSSSVYTISDKFSYVIYKAFLKYLYTGTIDLPESQSISENALELMELADMYCETSLKKNCSHMIKKAITVSNVVFFYNKAIEYNAKELEEFCFQFALDHLTAVVLSNDYLKLDMNLKDNFIRRAAEAAAFKT